MDSISQGVLGAAIGESILGKKIGSKGAIIGAIVATIPDLDVALYLFYDSFDMLSIHRGISHSILFSIVGALFIAFVLSKLKWYKNITYPRLFLFTWLCLFTHMLLDTFTSYGTQLFLPFSDRRVGFDSVNVVDPVYTISLIIGLVLSLWIYKNTPRKSIYNNWGLIVSSIYLLFTLINKERVNSIFSDKLAQENIEYSDLLSIPVGMANLDWYGVGKGSDSIYIQKYSTFGGMDKAFESFPINDHYLNEMDSKVAEKMRWFAKDFYTVEKEENKIRIYNLQVDMRGTINDGETKAPTRGYFEISSNNERSILSSGSHK